MVQVLKWLLFVRGASFLILMGLIVVVWCVFAYRLMQGCIGVLYLLVSNA
jgi:hypothetical protein